MNNEQIIEQYQHRLDGHFSKKTVGIALDILDCCVESYPESYSEGVENFLPHLWVVSGVCEALDSKKFWKRMHAS